ncbi:MAG TPA: glycosyltransferase family 39 protein [Anaerolineae bacterium]|nr:glycosyltransferase family 39 protein [Anaerolineae bacterium]
MSRLLLLLCILLAFALRVHALGSQSLWYDEAVTAQVVQQGLAELARWTADDIQPPLYYAITAGWVHLAGLSEWALRFPSVFFGVLLVPLAYALGRRLFGRVAGNLAALLAALHPLWLYYSQEARMYTLLTALGMLAGHALLRVLAAGHSQYGYPKLRLRWWIAFVLTAIALLYTHYFAAFLLIAFGLYFLLMLLAQPSLDRRRLLAEGAGAALLVILAYLPWLPNALRRFGEDASYWRGALKLDEALRHIAISFSTGETVLEQQAIPLAWAMAGLAVVCLSALLWAGVRDQRSEGRDQRGRGADTPHASRFTLHASTLFVLLYLLVPITGILLLSTSNPKFNPRYLMLASPALVLLLAGGLSLPFRSPLAIHHSPFPINHFSRLLSLLSLAALLAIFAFSIRNWFADPAFTKDDWRGAVAYVKSQLQPDEAVLLVSGHAYPAWRYYAPDVDPLRLPAIETLDVNAVLNLESAAAALDEGLAGTEGAWLVQWQDEVVDPTGATAFLLDALGSEQPSGAAFWGLGQLRHFRWPADTAFIAEPPAMQPVNANFAGQVELLGFSQPSCLPSPDGQPCPLILFWRALQPLTADLKLSAYLADAAGQRWSEPQDQRLSAYQYPTFRWQPGATVISELPLPAAPGTPSGEYQLWLSLYDEISGRPLDLLDSAGSAQGTRTVLEPVRVDAPVAADAFPGTHSREATPGLHLLQAAIDPSAAKPGMRLRLETWWRADQPAAVDYELAWQWLDPAGEVAANGRAAPAGDAFPTSQWPVGSAVRGQVAVRVPRTATPGSWTLRVGLARPGSDPFEGEWIDLPLTLPPTERSFETPALAVVVDQAIGEAIQLLGLVDAPPSFSPGETAAVTLAWQSLAETDRSYTAFVHLLNESGQLVAQDDHLPLGGQRPTDTWLPGEVVTDQHLLPLPNDLAQGSYSLEIGLYDANTPGLPRPGSSIVVGEIVVRPSEQ